VGSLACPFFLWILFLFLFLFFVFVSVSVSVSLSRFHHMQTTNLNDSHSDITLS